MMRRCLPLALLALASPLFGRQLIAPPTFGSNAYLASDPIVATNGTTFLTLWNINTNGGGTHVYGSVADANGNVLSANAFLVAAHSIAAGRLFPFGGGYLVGMTDDGRSTPARLVRLSADGKVVDANAGVPPASLYTAFNGTAFATVTYTTYFGTAVLNVTRLDGSVLRPSMPLGNIFDAKVAVSGSDFVVATAEKDGIYLRRFTSSGTEMPEKTQVAPPGIHFLGVAVASSGDEAAVAWWDQGAQPQIQLAIVSHDGAVLNRTAINMPGGGIDAIWNGENYFVSTQSSAVARVDRTGKLVGDPVSTPGSAFSGVAATLTTMYVVGRTLTFEPRSVFGRPFDLRTSAASPSFVLSTMLRRQVWPKIASDGARFLAIWSDETAGQTLLSGMIIDHTGAGASAQIDFGTVERPDEVYYYINATTVPYSVAFGKDVYLVAWRSGADVLAARVDRNGSVLDEPPLVIAQNSSLTDRAIAWNGDTFFVAVGTSIVSVRESGAVATFASIRGQGAADSITWNGKAFLVAGGVRAGCPFDPCAPELAGLYVSRFARDGSPIDPSPTLILFSAITYRIAPADDGFVIASDFWGYRSDYELQFAVDIRRVLTDGPTITVTPPKTIFNWPTQIVSEFDGNGSAYTLSWRYALGFMHWIGLMHLDRGLNPTAQMYTTAAPDIDDRPAAAATIAGEDVVVNSAIVPASSARIESLTRDDFFAAPAVPPPPVITSAIGTAQNATITWTESGATDVAGFIIELANPSSGVTTVLMTVGAEARSADISIAAAKFSFTTQDFYVRLRALNVAGVSAATAPFWIQPPLRHRTTRH